MVSINQVTLYGRLAKGLDVGRTRKGRTKVGFTVAVQRPMDAPEVKLETRGNGKRVIVPDYIPVITFGAMAEAVAVRLQNWVGAGSLGKEHDAPYCTITGIWGTRLSSSDSGTSRVHHECVAKTIIVHTTGGDERLDAQVSTEGDSWDDGDE